MSIVLKLVAAASGTGLQGRVQRFTLRIFGKDVATYIGRELPGLAARVSERDLAQTFRLIAAGLFEEALKVYDTLAVSYPKILGGVDKGTFAEMVAQTLGRGKMSSEALRGLLVERICRALPETRDLLHAMDKVMLAANKGTAKGKGWKNLRFAYSMVDGHGKQLGDLTIVCEHPDGRVWIMAIIESKSVSNTGDLAKLGDLPVGQHLWDFTRAKGSGVVIDGRMFKPSKVEMKPVPAGSWGEKAGAVATKSTDQRVKEMAAGRFTQFIGFVPREMTPYEALRVAADGFQLELWKWPFDISDFDNFQKELVKMLGRKRTLP